MGFKRKLSMLKKMFGTMLFVAALTLSSCSFGSLPSSSSQNPASETGTTEMSKDEFLSSLSSSKDSDGSLTSSSSEDESTSHEHTFEDKWTFDDVMHWHKATCGHDEVSSMEPHDFDSGVVYDATFEKGSYCVYTCKVCGYHYSLTVSDPLEHAYSEEWSYDEQSHFHACIDEGYEDLHKDEEAHSFEIFRQEPTFEEEGHETHYCSVCGYSYQIDLPKPEHSYSDSWESDETSHWHACTDEGYSDLRQGEEKHTFNKTVTPPDYEHEGTETYECSVCHYQYEVAIAKLEHHYSSAWSFDENGHYHACADEGYESLRADEASHDFYEEEVPPTFEENGQIRHICKICGYFYTEITEKLEHNYSDEWSFDENGHFHSCVDEGYEDLRVDYESHKFTDHVHSPTFENKGYTEHVCSSCGYSYCSDYVPELVHSYAAEWSNNDSHHWHVCLDSGYEELSSDYAEHDFAADVVAPTYEHNGYTTYTCVVCGYSYIGDYQDQLVDNLVLTRSADNSYYRVSSFADEPEDVIIPETYNGLPVRAIDAYAFRNCASLRSIDIPSSIKDIYANAFQNTPNLQKVIYRCSSCQFHGEVGWANVDSLVLSSNVASMASFELEPKGSSKKFSKIFYQGSLNEYLSVEIPSSNNSLGQADEVYFLDVNGETTFDGQRYSLLKNLVLPETRVIPSCQFFGFDQLESIDIPAATEIAPSAFASCDGLSKIHVSSSLRLVSSSFVSVSSPDIYFDGNPEDWASITFASDGSNPINRGSSFYVLDEQGEIEGYGNRYSLLRELALPASTSTVNPYAFYRYDKLEKVSFLSSSLSIGACAFCNCSALAEVSPGNEGASMREIQRWGFRNCPSLFDISFGMNLVTIDDYAFWGDISLSSVSLPDSLTALGQGAFMGCDGLGEVSFGAGLTSIGDYAFQDDASLSSISLPDSLTTIGQGAFMGCDGLSEVGFGSGLASIGGYAFQGDASLAAASLPEGLTSIGDYAFQGDTSLASVSLPDSLTSIGQCAFMQSGLIEVRIPSNVTYIGLHAFGSCASLERVFFDAKNVQGHGYFFDESNSVAEVVFGDLVEIIPSYALADMTGLTSISIGSNVRKIGIEIFAGQTFSVSRVFYRGDALSWCGIEFTSPYATPLYRGATIYFANEEGDVAFMGSLFSIVSSVAIPEGVASLGQYQFAHFSDTESFVLPSTLVSIDAFAFMYCKQGRTVYFNGTIADWCALSIDGLEAAPCNGALYFFHQDGEIVYLEKTYMSTSSIEIPAEVPSINDYVFCNARSIVSIILHEGLQKIGNYSFYHSSIESLRIPDSTSEIGISSFQGSSALRDLYLGSGLSMVHKDCFAGCSDLMSISYNPVSCTLPDGNPFNGCGVGAELTIGDGVISIPARCFLGLNTMERITIGSSVARVGSDAFPSLRDVGQCVYYRGDLAGWLSIEFELSYQEYWGRYGARFDNYGELANTSSSNPCFSGHGLMLLNEESGEYYALSGEVIIPENVNFIGNLQFFGVKGIDRVVIGNWVSSIRDSAFACCDDLVLIDVGEGVSTIGTNAFILSSGRLDTMVFRAVDCDCASTMLNKMSVDNFLLGERVTRLSSNIFASVSISNLYYRGSVASWCYIAFERSTSNPMAVSSNVYFATEAGEKLFLEERFDELREVRIPEGISIINQYQFYGLRYASLLVLSDSISEIEEYAFAKFGNSNTVAVLGAGLTTIAAFAFDESALSGVCYRGEMPSWCAISFENQTSNPMSSATEFYVLDAQGSFAIDGADYSLLTSLNLPSTVTRVNDYAFYSFECLTSVSSAGSYIVFGTKSFSNCTNLAYLSIENTEYYALSNAFSGCNSIATLRISQPYVNPYPLDTIDGGYWLGHLFGGTINEYNDSYYSVSDIPWSIKKVVILGGEKIRAYAFAGFSSIEDIELPSSLLAIGKFAFLNCHIKRLLIPASVISIDAKMTRGCSDLIAIDVDAANQAYYSIDGVLFEYSSSALIIFPSGKGGSYSVPTSTKAIGRSAFYGCGKLESIYVPDSVETISEFAFCYCTNLISVTLPFIGYSVDSPCPFNSIFAFVPTPKITSITVLEGCLFIESDCFKDMASLISVSLPSSLVSIGHGAFQGCNTIYELVLPFVGEKPNQNGYLAYIFGANDFRQSSYVPASLTRVTVAEGCSSIGLVAFFDCRSISYLYLPSTLNYIGRYALVRCDGLLEVTLPFFGDGNEEHSAFCYIFGDMVSSSIAKVTILPGSKNEVVSTSGLPSTLEELILPEGVRVLAENSFAYCHSLTRIVLPSTLEEIRRGAFYECVSLKSITLPQSIKILSFQTIYLESLYYLGSISDWLSIEINDRLFESACFYFADDEGSVIKDGIAYSEVTSVVVSGDIGYFSNSFSGCSSLQTIVFEEGVEKIGLLTHCENLETIVLPSSIISIREIDYCPSLVTSVYGGGKYLSVGDNPYYALIGFKGTLSSTIHPSCVLIGHFSYLDSISSLALPSSVRYISDYAFANAGAWSLTEITGGESVERIGDNAFYNCSSLASFPFSSSSLVSIGGHAFEYCSSLSSLNLQEGVTFIGDAAFYQCRNLAELTLPSSLSYIGEEAFYGCNLQSVVTPRDLEYLGDRAFGGNNMSTFVYDSENAICHELSVGTSTLIITENVLSFDAILSTSAQEVKILSPYFNYAPGVFAHLNNVVSLTMAADSTYSLYLLFSNNFYYEDGEYVINPYYISYLPTSLSELCFTEGSEFVDFNNFAKGNIHSFQLPSSVTDIVWSLGVSGTIVWDCVNATVDCSYPIDITNFAMRFGENVESLPGCFAMSYVEGTEYNEYMGGYYAGFAGNPYQFLVKYGDSLATQAVVHPDCASIGPRAFSECASLISVSFGESIRCIAERAFFNCGSLTSISLEHIEVLGDAAFAFCSALQTVDFSGSCITKIPDICFLDCAALTSVDLPDSLKWVGNRVFDGCSSLTQVSIPSGFVGGYSSSTVHFGNRLISLYYRGDATDWVSMDDFLIYSSYNLYFLSNTGELAFDGRRYDLVTTLSLPAGITSIRAYAFAGCFSLQSITLPDSLVYVGKDAFANCQNLVSVFFADGAPFDVISSIIGTPAWPYAVYDNGRYLAIGDNPYAVFIGEDCYVEDLSIHEGCIYLYGGIGMNAYLTGLNSLVLPESLSYWIFPNQEFCSCRIETLYWNCVNFRSGSSSYNYSISSLVFGDNVEIIPDYAFAQSHISEVVFPSSLISIGDYAFSNCDYLQSICFNEGLEKIGKSAFRGCMASSISIPTSLSSIGGYAFSSSAISQLVWSAESATLDADYYEGSPFYGCPLTDVVISIGVVSLPDRLFMQSSLTSITLPSTLKTIGKDAFSNSSSLVNVYFNEGLEAIGGYAFSYTSISEAAFPSSLKEVGNQAFSFCSNLKTIVLGENLETVYGSAFASCSFDSVTILSKGLRFISAVSSAFGNSSIGRLVIGEEAETWIISSDGLGLFYGSTIGEVSYEAKSLNLYSDWGERGIEESTNSLFYRVKSFGTLEFGDHVETLPDFAFKDIAIANEEIILPNSLFEIGEQAFYGCSKLKKVQLGNNVFAIGYGAFSNCSSLREILVFSSLVVADDIINSDSLSRPLNVYYVGTSDEWDLISAAFGGNLRVYLYDKNGSTSAYGYSFERL